MRARTYAYPDVGRSGLGNMMLPWARAVVWAARSGAPVVAPLWTTLRIGPYLRRERDPRQYQRLFAHDGYVAGARRAFLLTAARRVPEAEADRVSASGARPALVAFSGMEGLFEPLRGHHARVRRELLRITRPEHRPAPPSAPFAGIHVRRGDFAEARTEAELRKGRTNRRIPLGWYVGALREMRAHAGPLPARVFSDGTRSELAELLDEPDVTLVEGGSAVHDMLALADASVVVASGSTFSMWATYLGQAPTVWFPGQRRGPLVEPAGGLEPEWEPGRELRKEFVQRLVALRR